VSPIPVACKHIHVAKILRIFTGDSQQPRIQSPSRNAAYFNGDADDRTRVLLFGAYGSGNLGDAIQAISLLRAIQSIRQDVEVWACSQLPCQFPFPFEYVLPAKQIYIVSLLNQFDLG
jgi:hypothetical protein